MKIKCSRCKKSKKSNMFKKHKLSNGGHNFSKHCCDCIISREDFLNSFKHNQENPHCGKCNSKLTDDNWHGSMRVGKKKSYVCKGCHKDRPCQSFENNKNSCLLRKYNISLNDYNNMLNKQENKCAICFNEEVVTHYKEGAERLILLSVDHCHDTGSVRGLLCTKCNRGLGNLGDSIENLKSAIKYLRKYKKN